MLLSSSERSFIEKGVCKGVRLDGRAPHEARRLLIVPYDVPFASGGARASIGSGTDVLAVVKAELTACSAAGGGYFECAAHMHEGAHADSRASADRGADLADSLLRIFCAPGMIDLSSLVVQPGVWAWRVSVDIVVYADDGSLLDTAVAAAHAALRAARVPTLRAVKTEGGHELELSDDPGSEQALPFAHALPVTVTLLAVGGRTIVDASAEETACAQGTVSVGVSPAGRVIFLSAQGENFQPSSLHEAILAASKLAPRVYSAILGQE
jgi:exosome complex component RRP42